MTGRTARTPAVRAALLALAAASPAEARTNLLRFPDVHGDRVVLNYAGGLWLGPD